MESILKLIKEKRARMSAKVVPSFLVTKDDDEDDSSSAKSSKKSEVTVDNSILKLNDSLSDRLLSPIKNVKQLSTNSIAASTNSEASLNASNPNNLAVERVVSMQSFNSGTGASSPTEPYVQPLVNRLKSVESMESSASPAPQYRGADSPHPPVTPSNRALALFKEQNSKRMAVTNPAYSLISQLNISAPMTRRAPSTPFLGKRLRKGKIEDAEDESEKLPLEPSKSRRASMSSVISQPSIIENESAGTLADSTDSKTVEEVSKHPFGTDFKFDLNKKLNPSLWVQSQHELGAKPPSYASPPTERLLKYFTLFYLNLK